MILIPVIISKNNFSYYFTPIEISISFVFHLIYINPVKPSIPNFHKINLNNLRIILGRLVAEGFTDFKVVKEFEYILEEHSNDSNPKEHISL